MMRETSRRNIVEQTHIAIELLINVAIRRTLTRSHNFSRRVVSTCIPVNQF